MKFLEYRLKSNLTQQELADKLNISKSHISDIERDIKKPSISVLLHLASVLDTCPCRLLEHPCNCRDNNWNDIDYYI